MISPWLLTLSLVILLLLLIFVFLVWNFNYWKKRGVKGPKPLPLLGSFPSTFTMKRNMVYDIEDIYRKFKKDENFVGVFSSRTPQLLILDPKIAHDVYVTKFKHFRDNEASLWIDEKTDPVIGKNPFMLRGDAWKEKRSEITPALSTNRVKASYPVMQQICRKMKDYVLENCLSRPTEGLNAKDISLRYTSEVVSDCVMGIEAGNFKSEKHAPIFEMAKKLFNQTIVFLIYMVAIGLFPFLKKIYSLRFFPKEIENFFVNLMNDAIKLRLQNKDDRPDFLNYLLELQKKKNISTIDMTAHSITFLLDGFETSASAITHALLLLARYPEVQDKLRKEIESNVDNEGNLSFEKLHDLPYLDQCFSESLRLFSPLLFSSKLCTETCELINRNGKKLQLNPGDIAILPVYSFHHDEEFFTNANEFIPERFSEENGGTKKYKEAGVFVPFGDGPRICLGMRFAIAQSKAAIVEIIRNFKVTSNSKTRKDDQLDPIFFLASLKGGVWLDFEPIKKSA